MSILKKQGRCNNCGGAIPAGVEVAWKEVAINHRHGGNGTVRKAAFKWVPVHASVLHCALGVDSDEGVVAVYADRAAKLERQAEWMAANGDEEMVEFAQKQARLAKEELERFISAPR